LIFPDAAPPSRSGPGRVFKGVKGLVKRIWRHGSGTKTRQPFNLLRGDNEARARAKSARLLSGRMSDTAEHLRTVLRRAPDAGAVFRGTRSDMAKLMHDGQALSGLTGSVDPLETVLAERMLRRYLPEADDRTTRQRCKTLHKLRSGPLRELRTADAALQKTWNALEQETALEASLPQVRALFRAYADESGQARTSRQLMHDMVRLCAGMNMLRRHDLSPADFLYPAVKVMYERGRNAPGGANERALVQLLRDLSPNGAANPLGLRAQLRRYGGSADFSLSRPPSPSTRHAPETMRQGLMREMDPVLDGLAAAAQRVLKEQLLAQAPRWARDARPALFAESQVLYASAQGWQKSALPELQHGDRLLQAPAAQAVDMLVQEAMNQALGTPAVPAGNREPLLRNLTAHLSKVAARIDQALEKWHIGDYAAPGQIARLRRELMADVVEQTGLWRETDRLGRQPAPGRATDAPDPATAARSATAGVQVADAFRLRSASIHPALARQRKHGIVEAQRQINGFLAACTEADRKGRNALPLGRLEALSRARQALVAAHGASAPEIWHGLVDRETVNYKGLTPLLSGHRSVLRAHIEGKLDLLAGMANPGVRAAADEMLRGIWDSMKTAPVREKTVSALKAWCAALPDPSTADDAALFRQANVLRASIGLMTSIDDTVTTDALLETATAGLTDTELGALVGALADLPGDGQATVRQRLSGYLAGYYGRMTVVNHDDGSAKKNDRLAQELNATHRFLDRLYAVSRAQVEKRVRALENALVAPFRERLFAETGRLHTLLNVRQAREINGPLADELRQLISDAVQQARIAHRAGKAAGDALAPVRFLRTAKGYELASTLSRTISLDIGALHARLDAAMETLNWHRFHSTAHANDWRNKAVERIVQKTSILEQVDAQAGGALAGDAPRRSAQRHAVPLPTSAPAAGSPPGLADIPGTPASASTAPYPLSPAAMDSDGYVSIDDLSPAGSSAAPADAGQPGASSSDMLEIHADGIRLDDAAYHNEILDGGPIYDDVHDEGGAGGDTHATDAAARIETPLEAGRDGDGAAEAAPPRVETDLAWRGGKADGRYGSAESGIDTASQLSDDDDYLVARRRFSAIPA
jgi:hypothetical protein